MPTARAGRTLPPVRYPGPAPAASGGTEAGSTEADSTEAGSTGAPPASGPDPGACRVIGRPQRQVGVVALHSDGDLIAALPEPFAIGLAAAAPLDVAQQHCPPQGMAEGSRADESDRLFVAQQQLATPRIR